MMNILQALDNSPEQPQCFNSPQQLECVNSPQQPQCISSDQCSSDYDETFLDDLSDSDSWSESETIVCNA